ncbi:MAG: SPOR domain-containing protein [Pseudomonadota bacterium]|nr:SPOR domain-containing protein [Pseudomonadota bacterium]
MSKTLTVIFLAITLGGCIPLPISLGVSGWSYLVSGKSPTDHLISQTINQDCKILRLAVGKEPCAAFTNGERSLVWAVLRGDRGRAAVTSGAAKLVMPTDAVAPPVVSAPIVSVPMIETSSLRADLDGGAQPLVPIMAHVAVENLEGALLAEEMPAAQPNWRDAPSTGGEVAMVRPKPRPSREVRRMGRGDYALVLGSVAELDRAARLLSRFSAHQAGIVSVEVNGRTWHRVVVGPAPLTEVRRLKTALGRVDGKHPWIFDTKQS